MKCTKCNEIISDGAPFIKNDNKTYCGDCAFINNLIDAHTLKKMFYYFIPYEWLGNPIIKNNKVIFVSDSYVKKKGKKEERYTPEYIKWRNSIYKRDNYTCQNCGQRGGNLNVHHIIPFAKNIEKRIDTNNGITLCEKCHKEVHKR